ncbi:hypothetical protein SAMN04488100_1014 [Alkalibacterium putridalgicola]|uniref:Uncharacterized protein n=1 Tax=Alkalibacterium putridalgicola TaxID=426703 RepID=A0A1H7PU40_9LACT|nr:hypothetical protein [Alkalibacterium putridalgicola]GEK88161.1 hypothetical protein APU01nite_02000 [Alkalibacterium putridalgicola]SEL38755.1 hypothetical protein SAMN04488100_1014 [Alkalibacterium putridalgicola]
MGENLTIYIEKKLNKYKVFVKVGGVMEDVEIHNEKTLIILAKSSDEAINKWLEKYDLNNSEYLSKGKDGVGWSYYYPIICESI